jgi:hypothetical protein
MAFTWSGNGSMEMNVGDRPAELRSFQILSLSIDETTLRLSRSPSEKPAWILTGPILIAAARALLMATSGGIETPLEVLALCTRNIFELWYPAYPAAIRALKREGILPRRVRLRQCKYLDNIIEQDHRSVKKRTWLAKGYGSFQSAWRTLEGIETVNMIRKGRVRWVAKDDVRAQARFVANLFGIAA